MEPQLAFLAGEKKLRARMRERQSRMETAAMGGSIVRETTADTPTRHDASAATKPNTELLAWLGFCFCTEMKPIRTN